MLDFTAFAETGFRSLCSIFVRQAANSDVVIIWFLFGPKAQNAMRHLCKRTGGNEIVSILVSVRNRPRKAFYV